MPLTRAEFLARMAAGKRKHARSHTHYKKPHHSHGKATGHGGHNPMGRKHRPTKTPRRTGQHHPKAGMKAELSLFTDPQGRPLPTGMTHSPYSNPVMRPAKPGIPNPAANAPGFVSAAMWFWWHRKAIGRMDRSQQRLEAGQE